MVEEKVIPELVKETQRTGLSAWLGTRGTSKAAHHDLPLEFEERFLSVGLDPNDPLLALPVDKKKHIGWHEWPDKKQRHDGGPYNAAWRQQFDRWRDESYIPRGIDILAYRDELHSGSRIEIIGANKEKISVTFLYP